MTFLVDSDWVIDAIHGIPDAIGALERNAPQGLAVSVITYGEVYDGAFGFPDPEHHLASFRRFLEGYNVVGLDDSAMEFFAKTRHELRQQGNIIPDLDLLIAACAFVNDMVLMTRNLRHFQRIPALRLYEVQ